MRGKIRVRRRKFRKSGKEDSFFGYSSDNSVALVESIHHRRYALQPSPNEHTEVPAASTCLFRHNSCCARFFFFLYVAFLSLFLSFSFLFSNAHTFPPHCSPRLLLRPLFLPYLAGAGAGAGAGVRVKVLLGSGFGYRPTRNRCKRAFVTTPPSLTTEGMHNAQASSLATGLSR